MGVFGVFLGIGWLFWGKVFLPYDEIALDNSSFYSPPFAILEPIDPIVTTTTI